MHWVKDIFVIPLHENGANRIVRGVHFNFEWFCLIWLYQHWFFANDLFQLVERFLFDFSPDPFRSLLEKVIERSCDVQKPLDKSPIEIPESQDLTDFLNISGSLPVFHSSDFDWVHSNRAVFQYNSQELNSLDFELTLSWLQIQVQLGQSFQDLVNHLPVFFRIILCCHKYIIHIDDNFSCGNDVGKLRIHHSLKDCRRIAQSEWHYCWFE